MTHVRIAMSKTESFLSLGQEKVSSLALVLLLEGRLALIVIGTGLGTATGKPLHAHGVLAGF